MKESLAPIVVTAASALVVIAAFKQIAKHFWTPRTLMSRLRSTADAVLLTSLTILSRKVSAATQSWPPSDQPIRIGPDAWCSNTCNDRAACPVWVWCSSVDERKMYGS